MIFKPLTAPWSRDLFIFREKCHPACVFSLIIMLPQSSITVSTGLTETPKTVGHVAAGGSAGMSHFLYFPNTTSKQFLILYHMLFPLGVRVFRRKGCQSSFKEGDTNTYRTNFVRVYLQVKHFVTHLSGFLQLFVHLFSLFHFSFNSFSSRSLFAIFQFISVKPRLPAKLRDGV